MNLGQFIAARIDRLNNLIMRVARNGLVVQPVLYPSMGEVLRITQQNWLLVGLSRQRREWGRVGARGQAPIRIEYGEARVLDAQALRSVFYA